MTDAALLELRRLVAAVESQAELLAELQRHLRGKQDRMTGMRLAPAIQRVVGLDEAFSVAELAAVVLNATTPAAGVVRDVLADHADADGGFRSAGRLLARIAGVGFGGLRVERVGAERWRVVAGFRGR